MKTFVATPVSGRPQYLQQTLDGWTNVRGVENVEFVFSLEPMGPSPANQYIINDFYMKTRARCHVILNNELQGPAKNHFVALQAAYDLGASRLILGEEDILPSADALEYLTWGLDYVDSVINTALVCGYSTRETGSEGRVHRVRGFPNCWLWGTTRFWWANYVGKYWDSDFSTGEGNERGWDWQLARVMREYGLWSLQPECSRAQNIGEIGWSTGPGSVVEMPTFELDRGPTEYKLI